ncbi:MAG TPA: glycosyltransferase family 4 protein [Nitrospira sp.]|nr:glycosyltransferase family 4 protein [Nitrospira sp.]
MKIAQIAPLWERVPPRFYGGTERIVSYLTEELVRQGHQVTLFASADSQTSARLQPAMSQALRLSGMINPDVPFTLMQEMAFGHEAEQFDIIHSHLDCLGFPMSRRCVTPVLTTLHGQLDLRELLPIFEEFSELPLCSISNAQRIPLPHQNWQGTVYHGLPDVYPYFGQPGSYLAFLGRMAPEKRPDHAIEIARRAGIPLRMAAKVDPANREYFEAEIAPLLKDPLIDYIGEISEAEKGDFLGQAAAVLCPYDWPEPFGLVLIEALACGTPVLAYRRGSIPEIIDHGVTGFICENPAEMVSALKQLPSIARQHCRQAFEAQFTVRRMARDYVSLYEKIMDQQNRPFTQRRARQTSPRTRSADMNNISGQEKAA